MRPRSRQLKLAREGVVKAHQELQRAQEGLKLHARAPGCYLHWQRASSAFTDALVRFYQVAAPLTAQLPLDQEPIDLDNIDRWGPAPPPMLDVDAAGYPLGRPEDGEFSPWEVPLGIVSDMHNERWKRTRPTPARRSWR